MLKMEGMDEGLAYELAGRGVITMEDLAEQAVDELMDIEGMDTERAGTLIMTARVPWFAEGNMMQNAESGFSRTFIERYRDRFSDSKYHFFNL